MNVAAESREIAEPVVPRPGVEAALRLVARAGLYVHAAFLPISIAGMQIGLGITVLALVGLRLTGRRVWARSELDLPLLGFCCAAILSIVLSWSVAGGAGNAVLFRTFLSPLLILSALELAPDRAAARRETFRLLAIWAVAALLPSLLAWVQHYRGLDPLFELGLRVKEIKPLAPLDPGRYAATGFFTWYQRLAHNLTPPLCVLSGLVMHGALLRRQRLAAAAVALAVAAAVVLSFARSAWYGLVAAAVVLVFFAGRKVALRLAAAGAVAAALLVVLNPGVRARVASTFDTRRNNDCLHIWEVCATVVAEHPVAGVGFGNFPAVAEPIYWQLYPKASVRAWCHNSFFSTYAEGGLLLMLALTVFFVGTGGAFWRWSRTSDPPGRAAAAGALAALVAMFVNALAHDLIYASESMYGFGFALGVAAALARSGQSAPADATS